MHFCHNYDRSFIKYKNSKPLILISKRMLLFLFQAYLMCCYSIYASICYLLVAAMFEENQDIFYEHIRDLCATYLPFCSILLNENEHQNCQHLFPVQSCVVSVAPTLAIAYSACIHLQENKLTIINLRLCDFHKAQSSIQILVIHFNNAFKPGVVMAYTTPGTYYALYLYGN